MEGGEEEVNKTRSPLNKNTQQLLIAGVHGRGASSMENIPVVSLSEAASRLPTSAWQAGATRQGRHGEKDFAAERLSEAPTTGTAAREKQNEHNRHTEFLLHWWAWPYMYGAHGTMG